MFTALKRLGAEWSELRRFSALPRDARRIVFYAEGLHDWPHFQPIISELCQRGHAICYLTSEADDPIFRAGHPNVRAFCIGSGSIRTILFRGLKASVLVMTLPDLDRFHLKRSSHPVHYIYVFHSLVSTHMIYREGAFDHYDTLLCAGPHHVEELRRAEDVYGLPERRLIEHGYGRLDEIRAQAAKRSASDPTDRSGLHVLMAPSWGGGSLIESEWADDWIAGLLEEGLRLTVRLHPMTTRRFPELPASLRSRFGGGGSLTVETDVSGQESLHTSDIMISDWSGAALEYAFGLERPVLFVDTPRKVNNPRWEKLGMEPLEAGIRAEIGSVVAPDDVAEARKRIAELCATPERQRERLRAIRDRCVYNLGTSGSVGARSILEAAERAERGGDG